jgi:hypothetical protein
MWACKKKEKMLVCTQLFKVVRICNRIREWIFQQERFAFYETTLSKRSYCPGTVIISAGGNCTDIQKVEPVFKKDGVLFIISICQDEFKQRFIVCTNVEKKLEKKNN